LPLNGSVDADGVIEQLEGGSALTTTVTGASGEDPPAFAAVTENSDVEVTLTCWLGLLVM
jgi:hypothetical protein